MIKRGDIWLCNLDDTSCGCEQSGRRPVIILQNDKGHAVSPVTTVVPPTSRIKHFIPTHVRISSKYTGAPIDSVAMVEQLRVVDKSRLQKKLGHIDDANILQSLGNSIRKNLAI